LVFIYFSILSTPTIIDEPRVYITQRWLVARKLFIPVIHIHWPAQWLTILAAMYIVCRINRLKHNSFEKKVYTVSLYASQVTTFLISWYRFKIFLMLETLAIYIYFYYSQNSIMEKHVKYISLPRSILLWYNNIIFKNLIFKFRSLSWGYFKWNL